MTRSRNPHLNGDSDNYGRRQCMVCGCELPTQSKGRPGMYCRPATGRPCSRFARQLTELRTQAERIMEGLPSAKRDTFLRGACGSLRIISQDMRITAAKLDSSPTKAALVGERGRDKSVEQFGG